jgi:hypothetical protein
MKPQLQQKGKDPRNPIRQSTKAMNILGAFPFHAVSQITVEVASMAENEESRPSKKSVNPRRNAQKLEAFIVSIAVGYVKNARPIPAVLVSSSFPSLARYPTTVQTANPAIKLNEQLLTEITTLSKITGLLTGL